MTFLESSLDHDRSDCDHIAPADDTDIAVRDSSLIQFKREPPAIPLHIRGTGFQIHVWQALLRIPAGSGVSYGAIAAALGKPKASRAVGSAVGDNPVSVLIPCHRVIQQSGALGGYAWGLSRKAVLLGREWGDTPACNTD